ncbi:uncharacterized protein LOC133300508 [Gastrolobium bilobum]|uniref:uncharacterized protein LOC133300508 n=1 Tax=Gastrolobium bilobum TaxID=150636 RepID=UPI002AB05B55|nr:uncharacterized protein LOC133300508 [Gastrolobium bilobum]
MEKSATIDTYFKRKNSESLSSPTPNVELSNIETPSPKSPRIENKEVVKEDDLASLERDPALRPPIWKFPINQQDEICRAYLKLGPFQCKLQNNRRHFCSSWFDLFPSWLEYSLTKDAAFCLPCYLFSKPDGNGRFGLSTFVVEGFRNWKKIAANRLRLQVSVDVTRWLALQGCAFRGHDENLDSLNQGDFFGDDKVKDTIREEISNAKFCLIVDEASDVSKKEHMAIVLRFVDKDGFIRKRFFGLVHVEDTSAKTLKQELCNSLRHHNLRNDELRVAQTKKIARMIAIDELESGVGLNQVGTLHRAGATRWSSHYNSICSLFQMFKATCGVLENISNEGKTTSHRGDADNAYLSLTSFDFVIILHLMKELMGITEVLCQALQLKSQDISNSLHLVSTTKELLQKLRESGWDAFLVHVQEFCRKHDIDIPDMSAKYIGRRGRARNEQSDFSTEKFYRVNIFCATIDYQLQELNNRFNDNIVELLTLSMALDPRNRYKSFNSDDICKLDDKFYSRDFTEREKLHLKMELQHFELDIPKHPDLINLSTTSELC